MKISSRSFYSSVAGVSHKNEDGSSRQDYIAEYCRAGQSLSLRPEPDNPYDKNAVSVWVMNGGLFLKGEAIQIGYLDARVAEELKNFVKRGGKVSAHIKNVTGGTRGKRKHGVNIKIEKTGDEFMFTGRKRQAEKSTPQIESLLSVNTPAWQWVVMIVVIITLYIAILIQ